MASTIYARAAPLACAVIPAHGRHEPTPGSESRWPPPPTRAAPGTLERRTPGAACRRDRRRAL